MQKKFISKDIIRSGNYTVVQSGDEWIVYLFIHEYNTVYNEAYVEKLDHNPTENELTRLCKQCLDNVKKYMLVLAETNESRHKFCTINGIKSWFSKDQRVEIRSLINIEEDLGSEEFTLWVEGSPITLSISNAKSIFNQLEHFAKQCLDITNACKQNIQLSTDPWVAEGYVVELSDYPTRLSFDYRVDAE